MNTRYSHAYIYSIMAVVAQILLISLYFIFRDTTPPEDLARKIIEAERAKFVQIAESAIASGTIMLQNGLKLQEEGQFTIQWGKDCLLANSGTNTLPVDCSVIPMQTEPERKEEPKKEVSIPHVGTGLISKIDRSDSYLAQQAAYYMWEYNAAGVSQSPVGVTAVSIDDRAKQVLKAYDFDRRFNLTPGYGWEVFKKVGDRYKIYPEVLVCIAKADSSLGRALLSDNNIGNVGNNDRGNKVHLPTIGAGIDHIGLVLTNKYLSHKQSIGSLSPYGGGDAPYYATGKEGSWHINVRNCLAEIRNDPTINRDFIFRK